MVPRHRSVRVPVVAWGTAHTRDATRGGFGVLEFDPQGKAAAEITQLWDWMVKKMEKIAYGKETDSG